MTAVAALGVYRAYRHTMHDRVMNYLGLDRPVDNEYEWVDESTEESDSDSTPSTQQEIELTTFDQQFGVRNPELTFKPSG